MQPEVRAAQAENPGRFVLVDLGDAEDADSAVAAALVQRARRQFEIVPGGPHRRGDEVPVELDRQGLLHDEDVGDHPRHPVRVGAQYGPTWYPGVTMDLTKGDGPGDPTAR